MPQGCRSAAGKYRERQSDRRPPTEFGNPNWQSNGCYREDGGVDAGREGLIRSTGVNEQDGLDNPDRPPETVTPLRSVEHRFVDGSPKQRI